MLSASVPYAGKGYGRDAEIGGYVVLGNASDYVGVVFQQCFIPLLRGISYAGKKQEPVCTEAFDELCFVFGSCRR